MKSYRLLFALMLLYGAASLAPMAAHSWAMNLSIWFEVVTAAVLFALVLMRLRQRLR